MGNKSDKIKSQHHIAQRVQTPKPWDVVWGIHAMQEKQPSPRLLMLPLTPVTSHHTQKRNGSYELTVPSYYHQLGVRMQCACVYNSNDNGFFTSRKNTSIGVLVLFFVTARKRLRLLSLSRPLLERQQRGDNQAGQEAQQLPHAPRTKIMGEATSCAAH